MGDGQGPARRGEGLREKGDKDVAYSISPLLQAKGIAKGKKTAQQSTPLLQKKGIGKKSSPVSTTRPLAYSLASSSSLVSSVPEPGAAAGAQSCEQKS